MVRSATLPDGEIRQLMEPRPKQPPHRLQVSPHARSVTVLRLSAAVQLPASRVSAATASASPPRTRISPGSHVPAGSLTQLRTPAMSAPAPSAIQPEQTPPSSLHSRRQTLLPAASTIHSATSIRSLTLHQRQFHRHCTAEKQKRICPSARHVTAYLALPLLAALFLPMVLAQ